MTLTAKLLAELLVLLGVFFWLYARSRRMINGEKRRRGVGLLVTDGVFLLAMMAYFQLKVLEILDWSNRWVWLSFGLMVLGVVLHHGAVLAEIKLKRRSVKLLHGPVSHLLFFGAYGTNTLIVAPQIVSRVPAGWDQIMVGVYLATALGMAVFGSLVGVGKVKLPW